MLRNEAIRDAIKDPEFVLKFWRLVACGSPDECWLWTGQTTRNNKGGPPYGRTSLPYRRAAGGVSATAHRVAFAIAHGQIRDGACIRHSCDTPLCCNPTHLSEGSNLDNVRDRNTRGRTARGSRCGQSKLTEHDVRAIMEMARTHNQTEIARVFGVSHSHISRILRGKDWAHMQPR